MQGDIRKRPQSPRGMGGKRRPEPAKRGPWQWSAGGAGRTMMRTTDGRTLGVSATRDEVLRQITIKVDEGLIPLLVAGDDQGQDEIAARGLMRETFEKITEQLRERPR